MLPKIPDRRKTYYKITNKKENHYGLQYNNGLVIDHQKFNTNPKNSCVKGGIYFTTKEYLHEFFKYGCWIRPIKIPSDARVVLDSTNNKYRADKLFFKPRKNFDFYFNKLFDKETFPREDYWNLAVYYSKYLNTWYDKKIFPEKDYWYLAEYCSKYLNVWFNKETFPKKDYWCLIEYCLEYFDVWFDKKILLKKEYWRLTKYCPEHFNIWYDKKIFPKEYYWCLDKYCQEYKHIWGK